MAIPLFFGPYGRQALDHADGLASYGANAVWFHGFDEAAFEKCRQYGIAACVEFKTFRADFAARPELIPVGVDGKPIRYGKLVQGVCLSQKEFLEEIEAELVAGLQVYAPQGIWLDYLTYAGWFETPDPDLQQSCFCSACIGEFCENTGIDAVTAEEILSRHFESWTEHKCRRVAQYAERYSSLVRSRLDGCVVGAYMCPWRPDEYEGALSRIFAQDYALLAPAIDVFTPLIYAGKSGRRMDWGRHFLSQSPRFLPDDRKVQLILDVLDYPRSMEESAGSPIPSWGIQLFGGAKVFADSQWATTFAMAVERIRQNVTGRTLL